MIKKSSLNIITVGQLLDYYAYCDKYNESPSLPCIHVENGVIYIQYED